MHTINRKKIVLGLAYNGRINDYLVVPLQVESTIIKKNENLLEKNVFISDSLKAKCKCDKCIKYWFNIDKYITCACCVGCLKSEHPTLHVLNKSMETFPVGVARSKMDCAYDIISYSKKVLNETEKEFILELANAYDNINKCTETILVVYPNVYNPMYKFQINRKDVICDDIN
jgi:hypothetical protein